MYDRMVDEPRLTAWYPAGVTWPHAVLPELARLLSDRHGQQLANLGLNLYRNGADSVAWHGDRISRVLPEPVVAIVSLGAPRPFLVRPKGGGRSRSFSLGWGDLVVMGGRCQQEFDHSVPKVAVAGPRLSVMFRPHDEGWSARTGGTTRAVGPLAV
jgi:alkylated DNA repair dioxygenase AlkB